MCRWLCLRLIKKGRYKFVIYYFKFHIIILHGTESVFYKKKNNKQTNKKNIINYYARISQYMIVNIME